MRKNRYFLYYTIGRYAEFIGLFDKRIASFDSDYYCKIIYAKNFDKALENADKYIRKINMNILDKERDMKYELDYYVDKYIEGDYNFDDIQIR